MTSPAEVIAAERAKVVRPANDAAPYVIEHASELATPLPSLHWLCRGLRIARGSLTLVGGYGYSRKTLACQDIALSAASGTQALGVYSMDRVPVVHLDGEQGQRITRERYQRLARARGLDLASTSLHVATFPRMRLTDRTAREVLRRMLVETGAKLLVIDSLRAFVVGDENDSSIRDPIDMLSQVVKEADAAGILIHHARKPSEGKSAGRYSLRGSAAIFDAADSVFVFAGEKGEPTKVEHEKDRLTGSELDAFGLDSVDVAKDGDPRWGLRVVHLEGEQVEARDEAKRVSGRDAAIERASVMIRKHLLACGGRFVGSKNALLGELGGKRVDVLAALGTMQRSGELRVAGSGPTQTITLGGHQ